MRGLVWIVAPVVLLGACGKQAGVQISATTSDTKTKTVRLYVGTGGPTTRTIGGVAPMPLVDFDSWVRDPGVPDDTSTMSDGHADFFFETSGGSPIQMPIVIAVGFDKDGTVLGAGELQNVDVPDLGLVHYDIPLTKDTVTTWDASIPPNGPHGGTCVAYNGHMIVNVDDQDCDNNITGSNVECQPDFYKGVARPAAPNEFSCVTTPTTASPVNPASTCVAGGPMCTDGMVAGNGCLPSNYCATPALCMACLATPGFDCARNGGTSGSTLIVPHFDCQVGAKQTGEICEQPFALPAGSKMDCSNVQLRNDQQNFFPTLSVDHDQTHLQLAATSSGCKITITPSGMVGATGNSEVVKALMSVDTAPFQGFIVPVVFTIIPASGASGSGSGSGGCGVMNHCVAAPTASNTLVTDSSLCTPNG